MTVIHNLGYIKPLFRLDIQQVLFSVDDSQQI